MALDVLITQYLVRGQGAMVSSFTQGAVAAGRYETANAAAIRSASGWTAAGAIGIAALGKLSSESIKAAAGVQATKVAFNTLLGDAGQADALYKDIQKFSLLSPFNNAETAKAAVGLLAAGRTAKQIIPDLHAVANAVASVGGDTAKFNGVMAILSKLRLRSKASSVQLNQLALRGINPFKILQKELNLTADEVANIGKQKISGATIADALLRGFDKIGKGQAMENLNKTYIGKLSQMEDATDQFKAAIGESLLPLGTAGLDLLVKTTVALKDFATNHKKATAATLIGGGLLSAGALGYGGIRTLQLARLARQALTVAVQRDTAAEVTKTGVAAREAAAIAGTGKAATGTAGKLGLLARAGGFLRNPLSMRGTSFATSAAFGGRGALGSLGARGVAAGPSILGGNAGTGARGLGLITGGGALASLGLGAVAGVAATNNYEAAGYSAGESYIRGAATGIGAAGAAMFLPGGAVAVAIGEAAAFGINKLVNEPMERAAKEGSGAQGDLATQLVNAQKANDHKAQQALFNQMAKEAFEKGDETSATSFRLSALGQGRLARDQDIPGTDAYNRNQTARQKVVEAANSPTRYQSGQDSGLISNGPQSATRRRDGALIIPPSASDRMARRSNFNRLTPRVA